MTIQAIINGLKSDVTIYGIVGDNMFERNPIEAPDVTYLTITRSSKTELITEEDNILQIFVFSKTFSELETLSNAIIAYFRDRKKVSTETYWKIYFINQSDSQVKLDNGFYFNILNFGFKETI